MHRAHKNLGTRWVDAPAWCCLELLEFSSDFAKKPGFDNRVVLKTYLEPRRGPHRPQAFHPSLADLRYLCPKNVDLDLEKVETPKHRCTGVLLQSSVVEDGFYQASDSRLTETY